MEKLKFYDNDNNKYITEEEIRMLDFGNNVEDLNRNIGLIVDKDIDIKEVCNCIINSLNADIKTVVDDLNKCWGYNIDIYKTNIEFENQLNGILNIYTDNSWEDDPLDEREVDNLTELLKLKLNLINGNITEKEYFEELDKLWEER